MQKKPGGLKMQCFERIYAQKLAMKSAKFWEN